MQSSHIQQLPKETLSAGDSCVEIFSDRMVVSANRYEAFPEKDGLVDLPPYDAPATEDAHVED